MMSRVNGLYTWITIIIKIWLLLIKSSILCLYQIIVKSSLEMETISINHLATMMLRIEWRKSCNGHGIDGWFSSINEIAALAFGKCFRSEFLGKILPAEPPEILFNRFNAMKYVAMVAIVNFSVFYSLYLNAMSRHRYKHLES